MPHATRITNIVATLKGDQLQSANRVYVVSGHYDSALHRRRSNAKCDAPGRR